MNRKTINAIIALILIFFYAVSTFVLYNSSRLITVQDFYTEKQKANQYICDAENDANSEEIEGVDEFLRSLDWYFQGISTPYYITIFDSDTFEKVAETKSYVRIYHLEDGKTENCYIDKYLTDDMKNQIKNLKNENNFFSVKEFSYNKSGDEIIPVRIKITDSYGEKSCELVFSKDKAEYNLKDTPEKESKYVMWASIVDYTDDYRHGCYEYMREHINSEEIFWNGGFDDSDELQTMTLVTVPEKSGYKDYLLYLQMKNNTFAKTVTSYYFYEKFGFVTALYAVTAVLAFTLINLYITKKKRLDDAQYAFINAAAHELKTPLSVIQNQCECILENTAGEKTNEYVSSIYEESIRMSRLTSGFLDYNRLMLKGNIKKDKCNFTDIVNKEIKKYDSFARSNEIKFLTDIEKNVFVHCNRELIEKAVDNLISNAIKYSVTDSTVKINLKKDSKGYRLSVINQAYKDVMLDDSIWEPLSVGDCSRSNNSTGMGLTLAKKIFELHKAIYGFNQKGNIVEFYFIID